MESFQDPAVGNTNKAGEQHEEFNAIVQRATTNVDDVVS